MVWKRRCCPSRERGEHGLGLTETIVGSFMAVVIVSALSIQFSRFSSQSRTLSSLADVSLIKQKLAKETSCSATAANVPDKAACIANKGLVKLFSSSGKVLVSAEDSKPTRYGEWTLRAHCNSDGGVEILVAKPRKGLSNPLTSQQEKDFQVEPSLRKPLGWSNPLPSQKVLEGVSLCDLMAAPVAPSHPSQLNCTLSQSSVHAFPLSCPSGYCCLAKCPADRMVTGGGVAAEGIYVTQPSFPHNGWYANVAATAANWNNPATCNAVCCKATIP